MTTSKRKPTCILGLLVLIALLAVLLLGGGLYYGSQRVQAFDSHPLVLIHQPLNKQPVTLGGIVIVHATARNQAGVASMELWVDEERIGSVTAPEGDAANPSLVLNLPWEPATLGRHVVLVRAISAAGTAGQSSVLVEVIETEAVSALKGYTLEENESFESVAEDNGLSVDELADLNPDVEPEEVGAGDSVYVPDPSGGSGGSGSPPPIDPPTDDAAPPDEAPADEPAPDPLDEAPDEPAGFGFSDDDPPDLSEDPTLGLLVEVLALETDAAYEGAHCYVGAGESPPVWYPDTDGDQSTNESFAALGGGQWDAATYLSEGGLPTIYWEDGVPLPFEVSCIGVAGGGMEALELGHLTISIPPEEWDGITRQTGASGAEGSFTVDYRVTWVEGARTFPQAWEDGTMTPPTDLWINYGSDSLTWSYQPREDEEPIDGFLVFLNDTLIWVEGPETRSSRLPQQWLNPPCGEEYTFTVIAYHEPYPDGPYSVPSNPVSVAGGEEGSRECQREYVLTYQTLTTYNIPEDPEWENNWAHGMGPIYGNFYLEEQSSDYNFFMLAPNLEYPVSRLMHESGGSSQFTFRFDEDDEGYIEFGFTAVDERSGGNATLCHGDTQVWYRTILEHDYYEGLILSYEGPGDEPYCIVAYTLYPAAGSVVGGSGGELPLPWLDLDEFRVDQSTGVVELDIRNTGTANWELQDLEIRLSRQNGDVIDTPIWENFYLEVGQTETLVFNPGGRPMDICVHLDPDDKVLEQFEHNLVLQHHRRCARVPDLSISNVEYLPHQEKLMVTVENSAIHTIGPDGILDNQDLIVWVTFADGEYIGELFRGISLDGRDQVELEWTGISAEERQRMMAGYTVTVDPDNRIVESDDDNNDYEVEAGAKLRLLWKQANTYYYPYWASSDGDQEQQFWMMAYTLPRGAYYDTSFGSFFEGVQYVAEWNFGPIEVERGYAPLNNVLQETEFWIGGDQDLIVYTRGEMDYRTHHENRIGGNAVLLTPYDDWGTHLYIPEGQTCLDAYNAEPIGSVWSSYIYVQAPEPWQSCPRWQSTFIICKVE